MSKPVFTKATLSAWIRPRRGGAHTKGLAAMAALLGVVGQPREAAAETTTATPTARASDPVTRCIDAYEGGQEARVSGALLDARERFSECTSPACPAFVRSDCTRFLGEVEAEIPSVSFDVMSEGHHLEVVRISSGSRVIAERTDTSPLELDPGSYRLRFEAAGTRSITKPFVLVRGEKERRIRVELSPPPRPVPVVAERRAPDKAATAGPAPYIVLGVGALGLTSFVALGVVGRAEESRLARTCAPSCSEASLRSLKTKYLLADGSLAVGVTGILFGGYLLFTSGNRPSTTARAFPVRLAVSTSGASASVRRDF